MAEALKSDPTDKGAGEGHSSGSLESSTSKCIVAATQRPKEVAMTQKPNQPGNKPPDVPPGPPHDPPGPPAPPPGKGRKQVG